MIPWVITDTHLGHDKMFKEHGLPEGFEELILRAIATIVSENDVLIHLGDVAFYNRTFWHKELRKACKGKMWLTPGNHDKDTLTFYLSMGWDFVAREFAMQIYGLNVQFTHKPLSEVTGDVNIHGHLHSQRTQQQEVSPKHLLVKNELAPISLRRLLKA